MRLNFAKAMSFVRDATAVYDVNFSVYRTTLVAQDGSSPKMSSDIVMAEMSVKMANLLDVVMRATCNGEIHFIHCLEMVLSLALSESLTDAVESSKDAHHRDPVLRTLR